MINTSTVYYLYWKMQEYQLGLGLDLWTWIHQGQKLCSRNNTSISATSSAKIVLLFFSQSVVSDSLWPHGWQHARFPSFTIAWCLLKLISTKSMMPSNYLMFCCTLLLLPSVLFSIRIFSNELVLQIMRPKYWSFSFGISPSNEYLGLISFRIDWFDLLAVQENLKSLPQKHSSKTSILWHSAFFIAQLTFVCDYWKNHNFVSKVMSLFF